VTLASVDMDDPTNSHWLKQLGIFSFPAKAMNPTAVAEDDDVMINTNSAATSTTTTTAMIATTNMAPL